ncbi:glycosyltransferase [Bacillus sp. FJAT-42376]|uniref:glycosyltransferase n=1 Tax=Bacillus sp. FJAT-42376 TaxID=2014076 RepID=UPI000F501FBD|nr:glycosyltransferase family 2 protein [Bacillus sp. FJAT-42376]AZB42571.1 glycosyltransferase [Bacillus sp. FJAT-42376]
MLLLYCFILFIFLILTAVNSFFMPKLNSGDLSEFPQVSILVPLRNEERNVKKLITMLKKLTYPNLRFLLLNDQSEDRTEELLMRYSGDDQRFTLLSGVPLPKGWAGKVHACHTLSLHAETEFILFLDADVRLKENTVERAVYTLKKHDVALLTGFPRFPVKYLLEKLLVPMQHFLVYAHLPLFLANRTVFPAATAAHGAFMLFKRSAYMEAGGHAAIKDSIVDDVHLARKMKETGRQVLLANITDDVTCYMYASGKEAWNGFKKNIFPGFGRSFPAALGLCLFYAAFYLLPGLLLMYGFIQLVLFQSFSLYWFLPYVLISAQKMYIDWKSNQKLTLSLMMPLAGGVFICLMIASMNASYRKKGYEWKGRSYT